TECVFQGCKLHLDGVEQPTFRDCQFIESTASFAKLPDWESSAYQLEGPAGVLAVPGFVWDLAELVRCGARVEVAGREWTVNWEQLELCAEVFQRLPRKIAKRDFAKGAYRSALARMLPALKQGGWVKEDTSRSEHQLSLTAKAKTTVGKLKTDPLGVQSAFAV